MKSDRTNKPKNELRVELKYCEGCGGLGLRECGGGQVYCDDCARKMADLAVSKTPSRRPTLPVGRRSVFIDRTDTDRTDNECTDNECTDNTHADHEHADHECATSADEDFDDLPSDDPVSDDPDSIDLDSDDLDAMASAANRYALRITAGGAA